MKKTFIPLFGLITITLLSCSHMKKKADIIIHSTRIYSLDSNFTIYEALAVKDGKIAGLGTTKDVFDEFSAPVVYNALGRTLYPGFIDGHCHFYGYGAGLLRNADLVGTESYEEILGILKEHHERHDSEWILGRGWDQNDWLVKEFPTKKELDELFPENPVVLTRIDGHAVLANSEALKRAMINQNTTVEGGKVVLDESGEPTGILIDKAADFITDHIPELTEEEKIQALEEAEKNCFAVGLTSIVDAGLDKETILLIDSLHKQGRLKMKINCMLSPTEDNYEHFIKNGPYMTDRLTLRSVKLYADGALGSRGALLLEPYSDDPGNYGLLIKKPDYYREWSKKAYDNNYQVCTHTIGDSAARFVLDIYGEYLQEKNDKRWRIEHAQIIHPEDMHKFGKYSIIPSVQGTHATSDMYWAEDRLGPERIRWSYAFRELLKENGWIVNGTDFPIEEISPLLTFYATVVRKDLKGYPQGGFLKENALNREQALRSITIWAAKGSFEEEMKGSLETGKIADFVVLDKDLMIIEDKELPATKVVRTYSSGEMVYRNPEFSF